MVLGGSAQVHLWHLESGTIVRRYQEASSSSVGPFDSREGIFSVCVATHCSFHRIADNAHVPIGDAHAGFTRSTRYLQRMEYGSDKIDVYERSGATVADKPLGTFLASPDRSVFSYLDLKRRRGLVEGYFGRGKLLELDTGKVLLDFDESGDLLATDNAERIVVRSEDNELIVYDDLTPRARWALGKKTDWGSDAWLKALSRDGTRALILRGQVAQIVDLETGRQVQVFRPSGAYPEAGAFSPDGTKLALAAETGITVYDISTGETLLRAPQVPFETVDAKLSRDGSRLFVTKVREGRDLLQEWDLGRLELRRTRDIHLTPPASPAKFDVLGVEQDGTTLLYNHYSGFIDLPPFPARLARLPRREESLYVEDHLRLPDGRHVFGAGKTLVLSSPEQKELSRLELPAAIKNLSFSSPHLAVTTLSGAHLFEVRVDALVPLREEPGFEALAIAESDGMVVYRSAYEGLRVKRGATDESCSGPDVKAPGRLFARAGSSVVLSAQGPALSQWDCEQKKLVRSYDFEASVQDVSFSSEALVAVVTTVGGPISIIQLDSGKKVDLYTDGHRWALVGRDQLFAGASSAGDILGFARELDGASLDQYALHYNRPDLLLEWWNHQPDQAQIQKYQSAVRQRFKRHLVQEKEFFPPALLATAKVSGATATLEFEARDAARLVDLTVSADGVVAAHLVATHPTSWKGQVQIPLLSGQNAVELWVESGSGLESEKVRFQLRPQTGADARSKSIPSEQPLAVRYSPDGKTVAVLELMGRLLLVDAITGAVLREAKSHDVSRALAFSPDGKHIFTSGYEEDSPGGEVLQFSATDLRKEQTVLRSRTRPEVLHVTERWVFFGGLAEKSSNFAVYDRNSRRIVRQSSDRCVGDALLPYAGELVVAACAFAEHPPIYGAKPEDDAEIQASLGWGTLLAVDPNARRGLTTTKGLSVVDLVSGQRLGHFDIETLGQVAASFLPNDRVIFSTLELGTRIGTIAGDTLGLLSEETAEDVTASPSGDQVALRRFSSVDLMQTSSFSPIAKSKVLVVAWGVSDYKNDDLDLEFAARDATELGKWLAKVPGWNVDVKTFVDSRVTRSTVKELRKLAEAMKPEDSLVFFLAGHGKTLSDTSSEYYFLPSDVDTKDTASLARTGIAFSQIEEAIFSSKARNKLVLLDTCESGDGDPEEASKAGHTARSRGLSVRGLKLATSASEKPEGSDSKGGLRVDRNRYVFTNLKQRSGAVVFSAAGPGEFALESRELKHGLFTASLIEIVKDPRSSDSDENGQLDVREIETALRERVSHQSGHAQNPRIDRENNASRFRLPVHFGRLEYR